MGSGPALSNLSTKLHAPSQPSDECAETQGEASPRVGFCFCLESGVGRATGSGPPGLSGPRAHPTIGPQALLHFPWGLLNCVPEGDIPSTPFPLVLGYGWIYGVFSVSAASSPAHLPSSQSHLCISGSQLHLPSAEKYTPKH